MSRHVAFQAVPTKNTQRFHYIVYFFRAERKGNEACHQRDNTPGRVTYLLVSLRDGDRVRSLGCYPLLRSFNVSDPTSLPIERESVHECAHTRTIGVYPTLGSRYTMPSAS